MSQENFIELNRKFYQLSSDYTQSSDTDDIDIRETLGLRIGNTLGWDVLLKEHRVILLAEAGSGKTEEIRQTAVNLRSKDKSAFFIRLENISDGLEEAFEEGNFEEFQAWLSSNNEGWLLLDSVDEARLRHSMDFERAIKTIARYLRPALQRTHIIITGRVNAWRAKTDLALCNKQLEFKQPNEEEARKEDSEEELFPEDENIDDVNKQSEMTEKGDNSSFKVYSLTDLSPEQIKTFLLGRGISDPSKFLEDIERHNAWTYTTRPQDLEEIIGFWEDNKKVGTRLELMENSIKRKLNERDQDRADSDPISIKKVRKGVKLIAAATTFMHESTIRIPDGSNNTIGIDVKSILTDWDDKECHTLLSRPIFDVANYSTVRFHHRSVREFLTAEWLFDFLKKNSSRKNIEDLFFCKQYGLQVIIPSMRPILSWLIIFDEKIRKKAYLIEPEIIFECGDPSKLPFETRSQVLIIVCNKMSWNNSKHSISDYAAIQRFANPDMADEIRELIEQYKQNPDITSFLMRMIWQGRIKQVLPEAKLFALNDQTEKYTRIAAIRAVKEVGFEQDFQEILQGILSQKEIIDRRLLSEVVNLLEVSEDSVSWIFKVLNKTEDKQEFSTDGLSYSLVKFAERIGPEVAAEFIKPIAELLVQKPVIERRFCEVSKRFGWLMNCGAKALEKLIISRHPAALNSDSLSILSKIPIFKEYADFESRSLTTDISGLARDWSDLNHSLFWKDIEETRKNQYFKKGERLINFWQAYYFGQYWNFEANDFERIKDDITKCKLLDDRLVALSLAFQIYTENGRLPKWMAQLKKIVKNEEELKERLDELLHPPAQSDQQKKWKRQEAKWKRQSKARKQKRQQHHADWLKWLSENFENLRGNNFLKDGKCSNAQHYLLERMRKQNENSSYWTQGNWRDLIKGYGIEIATAFRDGLVNSWRSYKPTLRSEKDDDGGTPICVILGLSGLEIESRETDNWPKNLSKEDVELACRYAFWELNGFPSWFSKLHGSFSNIVRTCVLKEIEWELKTEEADKEKNYVINKVCWGGQWLWDDIAPDLLKTLQKEPLNLQYLIYLLKIIQSSSAVSDHDIAELVSKKCNTLNAPGHVAHWFASWIGAEPKPAIEKLLIYLDGIKDKTDVTNLAMNVIVNLVGGKRTGANARDAYKTPKHLQKLYLLMHKHIKVEDDINRAGKGVYSPELRDDAQGARNGLFSILKDIPGEETYLALVKLYEDHPVESSNSWIMHSAKERAEMDADIPVLTEEDFLGFNKSLEITLSKQEDIIDIKPNFHGLGINFNALWRWLWKKDK